MFEQPLNCKLNANEKIKMSLIFATQNQILRATLKALCALGSTDLIRKAGFRRKKYNYNLCRNECISSLDKKSNLNAIKDVVSFD